MSELLDYITPFVVSFVFGYYWYPIAQVVKKIHKNAKARTNG